MPPTPDDPLSQDRLNQIIRDLNAQDPTRNGHMPMLPPGVKPRPSGWKCPKCGLMAEQIVQPAPGTILGYAWQELPDGKRKPVSVSTAEVTGTNDDGSPRIYEVLHCLNCFNTWQRRKMMEEIRANVPNLVYEGAPNA